MNRVVLYLNIDSFPIALERVLNPKYRNRPVAVAPNNISKALIWACSAEAQQQGVSKGLSVSQAKLYCPDLIIIDPKPDFYQRMQKKIEEKVIQNLTPYYERDEYGRLYLEMTGFQLIYGNIHDMANLLQKKIKEEFKLFPSVGGACNKLVSKVAANCIAQREIEVVEIGQEEHFLSPLPLDVLPIVKKLKQSTPPNEDDIFTDLNLSTVQDVINLDQLSLTIIFGHLAKNVHLMARGIDETPVLPKKKELTFYEQVTLEESTNEERILLGHLWKMTEKVCSMMRARRLTCQKIALFVRYSDYKTAFGERKFAKNTNIDNDLYEIIVPLFDQVVRRRTSIRFISIEFKELVPLYEQLCLFGTTKIQNVTNTIDHIRSRFGEHLLKRGGI